MGLADRGYMKDDAQGGRPRFTPGAAAPHRGLTVTTWLIIICVGVFVIDDFLPVRWQLQGLQWAPGVTFSSQKEQQDVLKRLTKGSMLADVPQGQRIRPGTPAVRPLVDAGGRVVATEIYRAQPFLQSLLHFSTSRALVHQAPDGSLRGFEFWRFIGFQFLHGGIWHLAFNMIGLWVFGPIVERTLGGKRFLAFYLLCGICGALMYLLLNAAGSQLVPLFGPQAAQWLPFLLFNDPTTPLVGASAGVFGVLMAGAYLVPHATVYVYGILPMRLDTLAYALVGISVLTVFLSGRNAGGEAAHIGGAIAGWFLIRRPHHLHGFFDFLGRVDPTSRSRKLREGALSRPDSENAEVDRILRKVHESGLHSLSASEREALKRASAR